jgi:murein DD-endopeptidase MepM/ murein hydrolase activator NlpD
VLAALVLVAVAPTALGSSRAESSLRAAGSEQLLTPVTQSVMSVPRWYPGADGRVHMQYELMLTNTLPLSVGIDTIEVRGGGRQIETLSGDRLAAAMTPLGSPADAITDLPAATVGIVWVDLSFASRRAMPPRVNHRLTIDVGPGLPLGPKLTETGGRATVSRRGPVVVAAPLRGGRWAAAGGTLGPHRRALQAVNGQLRLSQRFAVDFVARLDAEGRTHIGDPNQNVSYFNYGQPVLAVADGKVVEAVDRLPDQTPNAADPVPLADAGGNSVILKLDRGVFAAYGHLKPGSVRVHRGQRVRAGQVLGKLGNSGQSSGPHLHLQFMNRPSFPDADGLPFVFERFRLDGVVPSLDALIDADLQGTPVPIDASGAGERRRRGITGLEVVEFP